MKTIVSYALARLAEPSTWRGIVLLATALGVKLSPELSDAIIPAGIAIAGVLGALLPDSK